MPRTAPLTVPASVELTGEVAQPGPLGRSIRQVVIVLTAVLVAIPTALAGVPIPDKYDGAVATVIGIVGAIVMLVTIVLNAIEGRVGGPLVGVTPQPAASSVRSVDEQLDARRGVRGPGSRPPGS